MSDKVTPELVEKAFRIRLWNAMRREVSIGDDACYRVINAAWKAFEPAVATPLVKMREALEATKETLTLLNDRFEAHMGKRSAEIDILLTEIDAALSSNLEGG